jgi:periplasmic protein TonB
MKKNILNLLFMLAFALSAKAQISESSTEQIRQEEEVFVFVEQEAEFYDGYIGLKDWLIANVQYPKSISRKKKSGEVVVNFTIENTGIVTNTLIFKGLDDAFDKELIRLFANMPKWKAAKQNGKKLPSKHSLMIKLEKGKISDARKVWIAQK